MSYQEMLGSTPWERDSVKREGGTVDAEMIVLLHIKELRVTFVI